MKYIKIFDSDDWISTNPVRWVDKDEILDILTELLETFGNKEKLRSVNHYYDNIKIYNSKDKVGTSMIQRVVRIECNVEFSEDQKEEFNKCVFKAERRFRYFIGDDPQTSLFRSSIFNKNLYLLVMIIPDSRVDKLNESISSHSTGIITKLTYEDHEDLMSQHEVESISKAEEDLICSALSDTKYLSVNKVKRFHFDEVKSVLDFDYTSGYLQFYKCQDEWWIVESKVRIYNSSKVRWEYWLVDGIDGIQEWISTIFPKLRSSL